MSRGALKIIGFGLAALLVAGAVQLARVRSENQRIARDFVDSIASLHQRQAAQNAALQARFDQLDFDHALGASMLASVDGVRQDREMLARFRALLAERERLAADQSAAGHRLIEQLPAGVLRDGALRGEAQTAGHIHQLQDNLSHSETANADAIQAILEWADRNHARLHARGDKLMVDGQQPLDELQRLEATLRETGRVVQAALDQGRALQAESGRTLVKLQSDVRQ
jgi:hypothetical protein